MVVQEIIRLLGGVVVVAVYRVVGVVWITFILVGWVVARVKGLGK